METMTTGDKKIFAAIFVSIFGAVMGVGIVVPLLPVYAQNLGASGFYIGLIFAAFSLSRTFLLPLFGSLSDRTGRKPYITIGLFGYALVSVAFIYSDTVGGLIGLRFLQGIASAMIMPVAHAYIGDITPKNREGFTMGLFNLSMFTSLSIGPLLGGVINDLAGLDAAFAGMGVLSLAACLASLFLLPPVRKEHVMTRGSVPVKWSLLLTDRFLYGLFCLRFVYVFCIGTIWCFLPVFASRIGLSSSRIGVLIMLGVFVSGLLQMPMGMLADRTNQKRMAICGGLMTAGAMVVYTWAVDFWGLFAASVAFGISGGVAMPPLMAMAVVKGGETRAMGSVMSLLTVAHSMGMLFGAAIGGVAMDFFSLRQAFPFAGLIMVAGVVIFAVCTYSKRCDVDADTPSVVRITGPHDGI